MLKNRYRPRLDSGARPDGRQPRTSCAPQKCTADIRERLKARMADLMREMEGSGLAVTVESLKERGYPEAVIRKIGPLAARHARRASVRQTDRHQGPASNERSEAVKGGTETTRRVGA